MLISARLTNVLARRRADARSMVGLLAAVGTAMSAPVALAHGALVRLTIADAAAATGLAAYLALSPFKKTFPRNRSKTSRLRFAQFSVLEPGSLCLSTA
jgi:hypothetical protein